MINFRAAVRPLIQQPAFTAVAVLTIAIGIGANAALFSVYDQLVLNPIDVPNPRSLIVIETRNPQFNVAVPNISWPRYVEVKRKSRMFATLGISAFDSLTLTGDGEPQALNAQRVDASFFPTLRVMPARGRNFTAEEDVPNGPAVCIISHELWQAQFGGRDGIVGENIMLNGRSWQVIGIMPPHLTAPFRQVQVFAPRVFEVNGITPAQVDAGSVYAQAFGRLAPGVTMAQAREELAAISKGYQEQFGSKLDGTAPSEARTEIDQLTGPIQPTFLTLLGAVGFVLLIACANVASLFLGRLNARHREIAVRQSLGAGRAQILGQFITESLVFSTIAGAIGVLLGVWALWAMQSTLAAQLPPNTALTMNGRAVAFAAFATFVSALLVGFAPAWHASRPNIVDALKEGSRGSTSRSGLFRSTLIVTEVALSVVLLVGSTLLLLSFIQLQRTAPGFDPTGLANAIVSLPTARYTTPAQQADFYVRAVDALKANPQVKGAAVVMGLPMSGFAPRAPYQYEGQPILPLSQRPFAQLCIVTEDYFKVLHIALAEGRAFTADDRLGAPNVAIINQSLAKRIFPGQSPLGHFVMRGVNSEFKAEIVGVIRDVKSAGLNVAAPDEIYYSARQLPRPGMALVAGVDGDPARLQSILRDAVASVDKDQPVTFFATLESNIANTLGTQRLVALLTTVFAGIALALSAVGLYSVLAYAVTQRVAEIGIRMALGAQRGQVIGLIMKGGAKLVGLGLVAGIVGAIAVARLIQSLLFNVTALDPLVYTAVVLLFSAVAALACLIPSWRASRIDPVVALQQ
ncbi:MAG: ABC transporter permease [Acidobacteriota bacterium]